MRISIFHCCGLYAIIWCFISYFFTPVISYDAVEALNWGVNKEWGAPKNPWFVGVMMWPAIYFPQIPIIFYWYAIHFICISVGISGVWYLTKEISGKSSNAWFSVFALSFSGGINIDAIEFNDNYLLIMLWPWMLFLFVKSVYDKSIWWLAFFFVSSLAAMTKYSSFSFFIMMVFICFLKKDVRDSIKNKFFLIGMSFFVFLCLQNLIWLFNHDFAAFKWVTSQLTPGLNLFCMVVYFLVFYPVLVFLMAFRILKIKFDGATPLNSILNYIVIPPISLIFIWFSFNYSDALYEWVQPFLIVSIPLVFSRANIPPYFYKWSVFAFFFIAISFILYFTMKNYSSAFKSSDGVNQLCLQVEKDWHTLFARRLIYVGGDKLSQWMTVYANDRPVIMTPWSSKIKTNVYTKNLSEIDIIERGAVIFGKEGLSCKKNTLNTQKDYSYFDTYTNQLSSVCVVFVPPRVF